MLVFDGEDHGVLPNGPEREVSYAGRHALVADEDGMELQREPVVGQHGGDHEHVGSGPYAGGLAVDLTAVERDCKCDCPPVAHGLTVSHGTSSAYHRGATCVSPDRSPVAWSSWSVMGLGATLRYRIGRE